MKVYVCLCLCIFTCNIGLLGHKEDTNFGESVGITWYCTSELIVIGFVTTCFKRYLPKLFQRKREGGRTGNGMTVGLTNKGAVKGKPEMKGKEFLDFLSNFQLTLHYHFFCKNKHGIIVEDNRSVLQLWADYFKELLNPLR